MHGRPSRLFLQCDNGDMIPQGGTSMSGGRGGGGGLDLASSLEAKFGARNLGTSVTTRCKNWERITILGAFGVISEIQRAKFGVSVTYIFGGRIWGSDMNFRGKIWGQAPPRPPYMEVTPLGMIRSPGYAVLLLRDRG